MRKLFLLLSLAIAAPASAAVTVIGNSSARLCYEAAESELASSVNDIDQCDRALRGDPLTPRDTVATYVNRGILLLRRGDMDLALRDFDTAIARDPKEPEAYLNKGAALMRNPAKPDVALPLFTAALDHGTSQPALAHYGRGLAHELMGDLKSAYFDYTKATELDPEWAQPREELARFTVRRN